MTKVENEKNKKLISKYLTRILVFLLLYTGLLLLLSFLIESAVVETLTNRYLLQHYSASELAGNQAQAEYEGTIMEEDVQIQALPNILTNLQGIDGDQVLGAISIPSVGLYQPIFNGSTQASLIAGAGTMKPGQVMGKGNYCLAGHHMLDESLLFGPILNVKKGDWIQLTDKTNVYTYEVTNMEIILQTQLEYLEETKEPTVTLFTCNQSGVSTQHRYMVQGVLIDTSEIVTEKTVKKTTETQSQQVEEQETTMNEYLEIYHHQTRKQTYGVYKLLLWLVGSGLLAAFLTWLGAKLLQKSEDEGAK